MNGSISFNSGMTLAVSYGGGYYIPRNVSLNDTNFTSTV